MAARSSRVTFADLISYFSGDYLELDRSLSKAASASFAPAAPVYRSLMPLAALPLRQEVTDR